ncbi:MAG TPA: chromosome segregation protein SMC [Bacillota bacterium]|nr:chromosome segregation protein SMC [Bacillota bacterium]
MHLKRLELQGFKSFAARAEVEIEEGVTAVVGPNGSGKSNLAEALRWALGEQNVRQLRGLRMEDVIFHGSDRRKPAGMAEVEVTFDNGDGRLPVEFAEVTLVRRVYRNGEGEYTINRAPARLKDIQELLTHLGLGRDGYAMLEQSRIEEILRSRPEDRRPLFEEAVGITRHRHQQQEAIRKLEETGRNLTRVSDIIAELEQQLEPLRPAAATARAYLAMRDERDGLESALRAKGLDRIARQWSQLSDHKLEVDRQLEHARRLLAEAEGTQRASRLALGERDRGAAQLESAVLSLSAELRRVEAEQLVAGERERQSADAVERLNGELIDGDRLQTEGMARAAERERDLAQLQERLTRLSKERERQEAKRAETESLLRAREAALAERKRDLAALADRISSARHLLRRAEEELAVRRSRVERMTWRQADLLARRDRTAASVAEVERGEAELLAQAAATATELAVARERLCQLTGETDAARSKVLELNGLAATARARLEALAELDPTLEGLPPAAQALLELGPAGLLGPLVDFVDVPAGQRRALQAAIEQYADCLLVDQERLPAVLGLARGIGSGRTLLWPVPVPAASPRLEPGGSALVVRARGPAAEVLERLLAGIRVAPDLEAAVAMARAADYSHAVVTLEGDFVHPGGGITLRGGTSAQRWGRRGELAELAGQVDEAKRAGEAAATELGRREEAMARAVAEVAAASAAVTRQEAALTVLVRDRERLTRELQRDASEAKGVAAIRERSSREVDQLAGVDEERRRELAGLEEASRNLQSEVHELESSVAGERGQLQQQVEAWVELRADLAATEQREIATRRALDEVRAGLVRAGDELRARRARIEQALLQQTRARQEAAGLQARREALLAEIGGRRQELESVSAERQGLIASASQSDAALGELRNELEVLQRKSHEFELKSARLESEYGSLARDPHPAPAAADLGGRSEADARARVRELSAQLEAMGEVNPGAVAECRRLEERVQFFTSERADLGEARRGLDRLLGEIDQAMARRFQEGFRAIGAAFAQIFSNVFGGGRGELVLDEPGSPLAAGVDIRVQPPGKRPQHLNLLSAGERALTAIALLFAFLEARPVPFCVLDEVDAALDDGNAAKFAQMLRQYCGRTQFLVVTHNKSTMEAADALYGVTMEEGGVSRLVSLRLAEAASQAGKGGPAVESS